MSTNHQLTKDRIIVTNINNRQIPAEKKIYIGRKNIHLKLAASPLQNPYPVSKYGTDQAMELFKQDFAEWENNPVIADEMHRIFSKLLIGDTVYLCCWCKTKKNPDALCHGDVIKEELIKMADRVSEHYGIK